MRYVRKGRVMGKVKQSILNLSDEVGKPCSCGGEIFYEIEVAKWCSNADHDGSGEVHQLLCKKINPKDIHLVIVNADGNETFRDIMLNAMKG